MIRNILIICLISLLSACSGLNRLSLYNLSQQYDESTFTHLEAVAYSGADNNCVIYVPVIMSDMVIAEDEDGHTHREALLTYSLFESYDSRHILDSASVLIADSNLVLFDTLVTLELVYPAKQRYILKLELTDLNRIDAVSCYLNLDNTGKQSANHFLLRDGNGDLLFSNVLSEEETFDLTQADKELERLYVRYYNREFPLALPPFLEESETYFDYKADSVFAVPLTEGRTPMLQFHEEGFYHFQSDSTSRGGFTIFRFGRGFPKIITPTQMLEPLRYITTMPEYEKLEGAVDIKLAIDNFWLENAGNPTRARAMIQKYYKRVEEANRFFSSYHEGWKTDRGLIYIIYGPPKIVYRGDNIEEWLYGEKGNKNSIRLQFIKVVNPFSENDYSLIKSPSYKEKWYNIVSTWRR